MDEVEPVVVVVAPFGQGVHVITKEMFDLNVPTGHGSHPLPPD